MIKHASLLKAIAVSLAFSALAYGCSEPEPAQRQDPSFAIPNMKRPNLVVSDMERSLRIYRDILGLTATDIRPGSKESFSYPVFNVPTSADFRFVSLHEPGEKRILNLTEVTGMDLPRPPSEPYMSALVIGIEGLEAKFKQLADLGLNITPSKVAEGADFDFVEQAFIDPDGHLIVCYEILPS